VTVSNKVAFLIQNFVPFFGPFKPFQGIGVRSLRSARHQFTTLRELPANIRFAPTAKLLADLDSDWSILLPRNVTIGSWVSISRALPPTHVLPCLSPFHSTINLSPFPAPKSTVIYILPLTHLPAFKYKRLTLSAVEDNYLISNMMISNALGLVDWIFRGFKTREFIIMLVGESGSGKSTLLYQWKQMKFIDLRPTIMSGFEFETFEYPRNCSWNVQNVTRKYLNSRLLFLLSFAYLSITSLSWFGYQEPAFTTFYSEHTGGSICP
jgi:hypothetical protein